MAESIDESSCILCGRPSAPPRETFSVDELTEDWRRSFAVDVRPEFANITMVSLYHCSFCDLDFFIPAVTGSSEFYGELAKFPWYYMSDKWEFSMAEKDVPHRASLVEFGCGKGDFLKRVRSRKKADVLGVELGTPVVPESGERDIPMMRAGEGLTRRIRGVFPKGVDVVCAFQFLEHAANPRAFIEDVLSVLRPGGRLLISVPNDAGFLKDIRPTLHTPPHHVTRWSPRTLEAVAEQFALTLDHLAYEPLARYHRELWLAAYVARARSLGVSPLEQKFRMTMLSFFLKSHLIRRWIRGHTIYARYTV
ncbi:MAG: methyltransferase domain-containing protein [Candidatus Hydrogenedentota bacterium]|nr:MAG: methyltransferase domain-containing protein [Candidatus Hydrogenedentota bacterium]